jgi:Uri superfamily endonuclease
MELYTLWHIDYLRAHTSHYSCLCLVKYPKLLLGYHLGFGSYYITFINKNVRLLFS